MDFLDFRERNVLIAEHQEEYLTLPAHQVKDKEGTTFVRLQFNKEELDEINRTGGIYASVLTFNKPFPPMMFYANNPFPYLQPISSELSVIYFKDINAVYFYTPDGQPIYQVGADLFNDWHEVEGYNTLKYYRIKQVPKAGAIILPGKPQEMQTFVHISYDKLVGGSKLLNDQFFTKEDNPTFTKP